MCPVIDGQAVSAAVTNPAFVDAQIDDIALGKIGFHNSDLASSGPFLDNIQRCVNRLFTATGVDETISDGTTYNATPGTISNGDTYEAALRILANKFDSMTGHTHDTSIPGDGGAVTIGSGVSSLTPSGYPPMFGDITLSPGGGITITPSGQEIFFTVTGGGGGGGGDWVQETPAGLVNNSNVDFVLSFTPTSNFAVMWYVDGLMQAQGVDYTITGGSVTSSYVYSFGQTVYTAYTK